MSAAENDGESYSAIILVIVLIGVAIYILLYGLQTLIYFDVKHWGSGDPSLYDTPRPLTVSVPPASPTTHLEFYGYQCEASWKGPAKTDETPDYIEIKFPTGPTVRVEQPEEQADSLKAFKGESPEQQQHIASVFGDHPFDSNYDLFAATYSASPAQVTPFKSRIDAERVNTLLIWKMTLDTELPGGTFQFDLGPLRGLQFGDPDKSPTVVLRAFNTHDRQFKIFLTRTASPGSKFTQADVNQFIATLKPIPLPGE
jgi:hypothetical protein